MNAPNFAEVTPTAEEPAFASISQLGQWLREGNTTPTKLAEYFLQRLEKLGPNYNALVTLTRERALKEAAVAEAELKAGKDRGPLHGIPYGVKDLLATVGYPTSWGAAAFRERQFHTDATTITKLTDAGAVLVGKLAMVEIAGGMGYQQPDASFSGPGRNPWNRDAWSGGSSTGPGAAVAAGLVPFAIGSETWGSIVTPATYCGITGLRPTYGRISRHGAMALSWTMDKLGPMTRSAEDAAWVLQATAGPDPEDPTTLPTPWTGMGTPLRRRVRFALLKGATERVQPAVAENFRQSLAVLSKIGDTTDVELPALPFDQAADVILSAEAACAFEDFIGSEAQRGLQAPEDRYGGIADGYILAKDYIRALRVRAVAIRTLAEWLRPFDAVITPAMPAVASPIDQSFREYFSAYSGAHHGGAANLAGLPCVCVPNGFGERGLPTGLLFLGRALSEARILQLAHYFQQHTDWHHKYPKV